MDDWTSRNNVAASQNPLQRQRWVKMLRADLRSTLLIASGALLISLTARGRELASFSFLLTAWMVIDGLRRRRSWISMGFRQDNFWQELKRNAALIGMVGVALQVVFWLLAQFVYPPLLDHILGRLASMQAWLPSMVSFLAFVIIETLVEEISCRGFVQGRLAAHVGAFPAILIGAFIHTGLHWQVHVSIAATILDLTFVFADNLIYGWIFTRSQNIFVAWITHLFADLVSLALV
jgi:membrane protease YdiL (CAAX protease family)